MEGHHEENPLVESTRELAKELDMASESELNNIIHEKIELIFSIVDVKNRSLLEEFGKVFGDEEKKKMVMGKIDGVLKMYISDVPEEEYKKEEKKEKEKENDEKEKEKEKEDKEGIDHYKQPGRGVKRKRESPTSSPEHLSTTEIISNLLSAPFPRRRKGENEESMAHLRAEIKNKRRKFSDGQELSDTQAFSDIINKLSSELNNKLNIEVTLPNDIAIENVGKIENVHFPNEFYTSDSQRQLKDIADLLNKPEKNEEDIAKIQIILNEIYHSTKMQIEDVLSFLKTDDSLSQFAEIVKIVSAIRTLNHMRQVNELIKNIYGKSQVELMNTTNQEKLIQIYTIMREDGVQFNSNINDSIKGLKEDTFKQEDIHLHLGNLSELVQAAKAWSRSYLTGVNVPSEIRVQLPTESAKSTSIHADLTTLKHIKEVKHFSRNTSISTHFTSKQFSQLAEIFNSVAFNHRLLETRSAQYMLTNPNQDNSNLRMCYEIYLLSWLFPKGVSIKIHDNEDNIRLLGNPIIQTLFKAKVREGEERGEYLMLTPRDQIIEEDLHIILLKKIVEEEKMLPSAQLLKMPLNNQPFLSSVRKKMINLLENIVFKHSQGISIQKKIEEIQKMRNELKSDYQQVLIKYLKDKCGVEFDFSETQKETQAQSMEEESVKLRSRLEDTQADMQAYYIKQLEENEIKQQTITDDDPDFDLLYPDNVNDGDTLETVAGNDPDEEMSESDNNENNPDSESEDNSHDEDKFKLTHTNLGLYKEKKETEEQTPQGTEKNNNPPPSQQKK